MKNSPKKLMSIIKVFGAIFIVAFIVVFVLSFMGHIEAVEIFWPIGTLGIIGITVFTIIYALKVGKKYRQELKDTRPEHKFKYIDTVYYYKQIYSGPDDSLRTQHFAFDILEDLSTRTLYGIAEQNTNSRFEQILENTKMLRIDEIDKVTTRKDWVEIEYNDQGSFWVDEEIPECYEKNDKGYIMKYFGGKDKIKQGELYHRNDNFDMEKLSQVVFITGWAEFYKK